MPDDETQFVCSISPTKNAITFEGVDGCHIQLAAPDTSTEQVKKLINMRNKNILATFKLIDIDKSKGGNSAGLVTF